MNEKSFSSEQVLTFLFDNNIVSLDDVQERMYQDKKKEIIKKYESDIWQGKDGRWRIYVPDQTKKSGRRMIAKTSKETLYEYLIKYDEHTTQEKISHDITVEDFYPVWIEYKKLHTTASTYITRLDSDWKSFYLSSELAKMKIKDINKLTLDQWAHKLISKYKMTRKKYTNMQTIIRQMLDYAVDLGIIPHNPMLNLKIDKKMFQTEKKKSDVTQVFTDEEKARIIELAWQDFHNQTKVYLLSPLALIFQFLTGLRIGELCTVKYEDIESKDYIHIQRMLRRDTGEVVPHTKTDSGDRYVYLTNEAKHIIQIAKECQENLHVDCGGYIFSINGKPLTERCIIDLLKKYCKNENILYRSSHKVRKTYGSNLLNNGICVNTVRRLLGHTDERTTLKYYCYDTNTDTQTKTLIENALNIS